MSILKHFKKKEKSPKILDDIKKKAKANPKTIIYTEGVDERILKAAAIVSKEKTANIILISPIDEVKKRAKELKLDLSKVKLFDSSSPQNADKFEEYAQKLFELRKQKGLTIEEARELLKKGEYYGTMMVYAGEADGMVTGADHSTADTLRPALQIVKTKDKIKYASSFFMMVKNNDVFFFADCAFIEDPNEEQLLSIAEQTADSAIRFGFTPKIAMLSFSTKGSGKSASVDKVRNVAEALKKLRPDLLVDGEMQLDAAIVPDVALKKCPNSPIKGNANVLIFPDLNSGNIGYKLVERFGKTHAIGPIVQGLKKPINDLSRGCSVEDIVLTTEITVIEAQGN